MAKDSSKGASKTAGLILLVIGCISIGYALAKIVNDLDGGGPLAGAGAMCAALATIFLVRAEKSDS